MEKEYMQIALKEAIKAEKWENVPVGAVIVKNNKVIAKAHNTRKQTNFVTSHAEIVAIERACKKIKNWRLNGCTMYVTLQPCLMCEKILIESRIDKVVYATKNINSMKETKTVTVFEEQEDFTIECRDIIQKFFKNKRK